MRRIALPVTAAAGILVFSGCGQSEADKPADLAGERGKVAQVIEDFTGAALKRDTASLCTTYFTADSIARIQTANGGKGCKQVLTDLLAVADNKDLVVKDVKIRGDRAETDLVVPRTDGKLKLKLVLRKSGGTWKIDLTGLR